VPSALNSVDYAASGEPIGRLGGRSRHCTRSSLPRSMPCSHVWGLRPWPPKNWRHSMPP